VYAWKRLVTSATKKPTFPGGGAVMASEAASVASRLSLRCLL
jgi:hypothetical protein